MHPLQQTSSSPAAVHNCIVSGFSFLPGVQACQSVAAASLLPQGADPLIHTRRLLLCPLRSVVPFPRLEPRDFNWRRPNPPAPGRSNSARLPGCRAYRQGKLDTLGTIVNMSFSCWPATTPPHRGATEIDHHRHLVPARQPGKTKQPPWPILFAASPGSRTYQAALLPVRWTMLRFTPLTEYPNSAVASVRVSSCGPQAGLRAWVISAPGDMFSTAGRCLVRTDWGSNFLHAFVSGKFHDSSSLTRLDQHARGRL